MKKREKEWLIWSTVIIICVVIWKANFLFVSTLPITGHVADSGQVLVSVQTENNTVEIHSPLNTTYNFDVGVPYNITLNVSASFTPQAWRYYLYDSRHSQYQYQNVIFTPNNSFLAVRWGNELTVEANDSTGAWYDDSVIFSVVVPNSAPDIGQLNKSILICEGEVLDYRFNGSDVDEDTLIGDISPKNPFFVLDICFSGFNVTLFKIFSPILTKSHLGVRNVTLSVNDRFSATCCVDSNSTNITVIEINNPVNLTGIGAQTVWTSGDNSTFYHQMQATDTENGNSSVGNLTFNISFSNNANLFTINNSGVMNFTPIEDQVGVYSITVCVNDTGLSSPHQNISVCTTGNGEITSECDDFTLTVTNGNRPPEIITNYPNDSNFSVAGTSSSFFNVTVSDPDGTIPDIDWYVDDGLQEHNENNSYDNFTYSFGCGVEGVHEVMVKISDGLENDTFSWNVDVSKINCPVQSSGGGGGGGGGTGFCFEQWACNDFDVCQNVKRSFETGALSLEDYIWAKNICSQEDYDERFCGFQVTSCFD